MASQTASRLPKAKVCQGQNGVLCPKQPAFGFPGKKAECCSRHKLEGMVNLRNRRCEFAGCTKEPYFGLEGTKARFCSNHKVDDMVDVRHRRCEHEGCTKQPNYAEEDSRARFCAVHRLPGMVDVKHRRCHVRQCGRYPHYRGKGRNFRACELHKTSDMERVIPRSMGTHKQATSSAAMSFGTAVLLTASAGGRPAGPNFQITGPLGHNMLQSLVCAANQLQRSDLVQATASRVRGSHSSSGHSSGGSSTGDSSGESCAPSPLSSPLAAPCAPGSPPSPLAPSYMAAQPSAAALAASHPWRPVPQPRDAPHSRAPPLSYFAPTKNPYFQQGSVMGPFTQLLTGQLASGAARSAMQQHVALSSLQAPPAAALAPWDGRGRLRCPQLAVSQRSSPSPSATVAPRLGDGGGVCAKRPAALPAAAGGGVQDRYSTIVYAYKKRRVECYGQTMQILEMLV